TAMNYLGGAQSACDLTSGGRYAVKHAPSPYFADERALCAAHAPAVGSSGFLDAKRLPTLPFVSPDLCDDTDVALRTCVSRPASPAFSATGPIGTGVRGAQVIRRALSSENAGAMVRDDALWLSPGGIVSGTLS